LKKVKEVKGQNNYVSKQPISLPLANGVGRPHCFLADSASPLQTRNDISQAALPRPVKTVSLLDETVFFVLEPDGEVNDTETKRTSTETNSSTDTFPEFPGVRSFKGHVFMTVVTTTTGHGFGNKRSATSWGSCTPDGRACKKC
jgi:hypothetical protein